MGALGDLTRPLKSPHLPPLHKQYLQSCRQKTARSRGTYVYLELHADTLNFMPAQNLYKKGKIMLCNLKCSRVSCSWIFLTRRRHFFAEILNPVIYTNERIEMGFTKL